MKYSTAEQLVQYLKDLDGPINAAILAAEDISNLDERREIRKALARLVGMVYTDLMVPICKDFPDLLPD